MGDRRPLSSLTSGDFDSPPATITLAENVTTRLDRLRRTLERHREETRTQAEAARHDRWAPPPSLRRRRLLRPTGYHSPTYEGRSWPRDESVAVDDDERPRQAKRRKLDPYPHSTQNFKYGHYGQVEPGRLKMELCSCDGGVHDDRRSIHYGPSNILKHDQSVYSSKASTCNIVLRHHDNTAFCLQKLYIIAPEHGFTAPVREGTVCVGMNHSDLISMTHRIDLEERQERHTDNDDDGEEQLSLLESLRDPEISRAISRSGTGRDESWPVEQAAWLGLEEPLSSANPTSNRDGRIWPSGFAWPPLDPLRSRMERPGQSSEFRQPQSEPSDVDTTLESGMRVTTTHNVDISWPEEPTTAAILADRQRRQRTAQDEDLSSDEGEDSHAWDSRFSNTLSRLRRGIRSGYHRHEMDGPFSGSPSKDPAAEVTQVPFTIQPGKHKLALEFNPPVSGTCILLQMRAPLGRNIDVQTVIASGFAGPRFLPAVTPR